MLKLKFKLKSNVKYQVSVDVHKWRVLFKGRDLVWVILSKEKQSQGHYIKLNDWKVTPCEVLRKINNNAH